MIFVWVFVICVFLLSLVPRPCLGDEFSGNRMNKEWECSNPGEKYFLPVCENDRQGSNADQGIKLLREAPAGDWQIETCISGGNALGREIYHLGLTVYAGPDHWLLFGPDGKGRTALYGISGEKVILFSLDEACLFLGIQKQEAQYSFTASPDGRRWTNLPQRFIDLDGAFARSKIGIMNRSTSPHTDIFKLQGLHMAVHYAEYAFFRCNHQAVPFENAQTAGWILVKNQGSCPLVVPSGSRGNRMPSILKTQKAGDWALDTYVTYSGAPDAPDSHAGLALYANEENWLIFGNKGGLSQGIFELGGMLQGKETGPLIRFCAPPDFRRLRILKRTHKDFAPRYYCYLSPEADGDFAYVCAGQFEDRDEVFSNKRYGVMGWKDADSSAAGFPVSFDYVSDYLPGCYADYFTELADCGPWTLVQQGRCQMATADGRLTQTVAAAPGAPSQAMVLRLPLKEDWVIETGLNPAPLGRAFAGLTLYVNPRDLLCFGYREGKILLWGKAGGEEIENIDHPARGTRFLRMVKDGDSYYCYASATGQSWDLAAQYTDASRALSNASYGLITYLSQPGTSAGCFGPFYESARPTGIARVEAYEEVCVLTGENSLNRTETSWGWGSGDLGSLFQVNGKFYMAFGDTFSRDRLQGAWIRNSIAVGNVSSFAHGLRFDAMHHGQTGLALPRTREHESAMIPSGGIGVMRDGAETLYLWIHEIYCWSLEGHRDVEGSAWAVSVDGGTTWCLQNRLFDGNSPFQFVQPFREGDTVYLLGNTGSGYGDVYLMRTDISRLLEKHSYAYFAGLKDSGEPQWSALEDDAAPVVTYAQREIGIQYNKFLGRYLMTGWDSFNGLIVLQEAEHLWGPWSRPVPLFTRDHVQMDPQSDRFTQIYGVYSLPEFVENGGEITYMTMTKYIPYQVYWMKVFFAKPKKDPRGN